MSERGLPISVSGPVDFSALELSALFRPGLDRLRELCDMRRPHYLAVVPAPSSLLSVVRSGELLRWQHPPALCGAGTDGHPEAPDRRPLGACPYRRQCAECSPQKLIGGLSQTVMGGALAAVRSVFMIERVYALQCTRLIESNRQAPAAPHFPLLSISPERIAAEWKQLSSQTYHFPNR